MAQDKVRILIASDIHAGYGENKPYIGSDSFQTFAEVLQTAKDQKVDFVLLGGDLFHENHPSRETQLKVVRLLRQYCLHEGNTDLDFLSDPTINFHHSNFPVVNYLDRNLRVSMPIFSIHGNHDDLSGKGLTALDVLHETGLINLFGKFCDVDQIEVTPILLQRGNTKIAIYGIGSQRDDRLARSFAKGRVKFNQPEDENPHSWFNILVLHQNKPPRSKLRTTKSHLSYKCIPPWFDIVIWGHEHECLIEPDFKHMDPNDEAKGFYIIQPGSTVATSLSTEEAAQKQIGILNIRGKEFKMNKIQLKTTRQIIVNELILEEAEPAIKVPRSTVRQKHMPDEPLIAERIEQLLKAASEKRGPEQPWPPRVRLKVIYSGKWVNIPPINGRKFGAKFADRVANAAEMIFVRVVREDKKAKNAHEPLGSVLGNRTDDVCSVDEMVQKYFNQCDFKNRLNVLSEVAMSKQLQEYAIADANTQYKYTAADRAMSENIKEQIDKMASAVKNMVRSHNELNPDDDAPLEQQITNCIFDAKKKRLNKADGGPNEGDSTMNDTNVTSFLARGYDPARIVTSTPRASQEREIRWAQSLQQGSHENEPVDNDVMDITDEFGHSP